MLNLITRAAAALLFMVGHSMAFAAWPPTKCTHVRILGSGDTDQISWAHDGGLFSDGSRLMDSQPNQRDALGDALDRMPEILCSAVHKVAFVYRPPDEEGESVVSAWTKSNDRQNLVYLNTWDTSPWNQNNISRTPAIRQSAIQRMIHESAHCAIRLIQSQQRASPAGMLQQRPDENLWSTSTRQLARDIIRKNRLEVGVLREWQRMHDAFAAAGMATPYWGSDWPSRKNDMTAEGFTRAGFMSAYGGDSAIEDIAEMTSWAIVREAAEEPEDAACRVMNRQSGPSINQGEAAIFTKLNLVRSLGFISEEHYMGCVGNLEIEAPGPGFHSYKDGNLGLSYSGDMTGVLGRSEANGPILFSISAGGTVQTTDGSVPVDMTLRLNVSEHIIDLSNGSNPFGHVTLDDVSFARGVYFVGARHGRHNRLTVVRRSDGAVIMDVGEGVALVGRSSLDSMFGSVAVLRIFNYSGGLLSAIAGDEPVREQSRVTFSIRPENTRTWQ